MKTLPAGTASTSLNTAATSEDRRADSRAASAARPARDSSMMDQSCAPNELAVESSRPSYAPPLGLRCAGVVALGAADQEHVAQVQSGRGDAVPAAGVLEEDEVGKAPREVRHQLRAHLVLSDLRELIEGHGGASDSRPVRASSRSDCERSAPRGGHTA